MKNINNILIGIAVIAFSQTALAQTKKDSALHQSMTVEREFSPIVRDANKIDQQPAVAEVKIKKSPTRYSDWVAGEAISSEIGVMPVGQVIASEEEYKRGFVELSAGNYVNADLKAGVFLNEEFYLDIDGFLTKGDLDLPDEPLIYPAVPVNEGGENKLMLPYSTWESKLMNGTVKLNYNHLFSNDGRLRAHILASGRKYNMLPFMRGKNTFGINENVKEQKLGRIWGWANYEQGNWNLDILVRHNGLNLPSINDNGINVKPEYMWNEDDWQLRIALDLAFKFGGNAPFTFYPELEYSKFGYGLNRFYVHLLGGTVKYDIYELMEGFPMALPYEFKPEKTLFDLTLGYEDNNNGSFKWGIYAGAKMTLDRQNGYMANWLCFPIDFETDTEVYERVGHFYHGELRATDEFEFKAGGNFEYAYNKKFGMKSSVNFNSNPQFGKAMLDGNVHLLVKPISKLSIDLGFDCGIKREMDFVSPSLDGTLTTKVTPTTKASEADDKFPFDGKEVSTIDLGNIIDLNLRADYQVLPNFSVFVFGKNLLNQEYQLWAGVPAQKINIHAGFNWKF